MKSRKLSEFIQEIQYKNRNPKDNRVLELLEDKMTNPELILLENEKLYRSRIIYKSSLINKEDGFHGYGEKESFVPPAEFAGDMRANYRYIPYLYCANDKYLSALETRPRLSAEVSICTIVVQEKLTLLDFTMKDVPKGMADVKKNLFTDLSELFSKPVAKDDDTLDYIPTQYIAEYSKNLGYDGIVFKSSLYKTDESIEVTVPVNVVVFNFTKCRPISSNVYRITNNYMDTEQVDSDTKREAILNPDRKTAISSKLV